MTVLERFSTPAAIPEPNQADADAWSKRVDGMLADYVARFPQFYDPLATETPAGAETASVVWSGSPADLRRQTTSEEQRWQLAEKTRSNQDEYCEWSIERNANNQITRVTFTTEVREYWEHVAERDHNRLLALYQELVSPQVQLNELLDSSGKYLIDNKWNRKTTGRLAHLVQESNNLGAAIDLAAKATVLREDHGQPVTNQQALVTCAALGNQFRNSDPQIAAGINNLAGTGADITLADPPGLYIHGLLTAGITTPDDADPASFWSIERGTDAFALRASFAVPEQHAYTVGDIEIAGRRIDFGAQLADRVQVRISALAKPGPTKPTPQPCET
jgi:hypothetical protein